MYFPFFQYGCCLEINAQRTTAYLNNLDQIAPIDTRIDMSCDCPPLFYAPDNLDVPQPITFSTPANDSVSWYDPDIEESGRFLGFIIEDVVHNAVASRQVTQRVSSSGGGSLSPIRRKERRLDFTVLMFACDELAMEYGFRFLSDTLATTGCDDACTLCDAEYRDSCHEIQGGPQLTESFNRGRWILKNVGLVDGPIWGNNPVPTAACHIRRVKFSIASEMPWKYKCPVPECSDLSFAGFPSEGTDCDNWDTILCGHQEVSCSVSEPLVVGETCLIIDITAGTEDLEHVKIKIRPDKFGYECSPETRPVGYIRVDPCDTIVIPTIPAGYTLTYDTSIETMTLTSPSGITWDGTSLIATEEGYAPTYPTLRCGDFCISVEASECSVVGSPTITIRSVHREI